MTAASNLDLFTAERLKRQGLEQAESRCPEWICEIRQVAREHARRHGQVTSDDLRIWADEYHLHPNHPNSWGAVFKGSEWVAVGYRKSRYVSNHARRITVWELRE